MTEIEEFVTLILPELIAFIKNESIGKIVKKELDNKEKPSIYTVQEATRND